MSLVVAVDSGAGPAPPDFGRWIRSLSRRAGVIVPLLSAAGSSLVGVYSLATRIVDNHWFRIGLFSFQVVVCLVLLFLIPKPKTETSVSRRAATAIEQFVEAWERLWLCWVLLYLVWTAKEAVAIMFGAAAADSPYWRFGLNLANNLQTMIFVVVYLVIAKSTVDPARAVSKLPWNRGFAILACVTMLDFVATLAVTLTGVQEAFRPLVHFASTGMLWACGMASGAALALVVGRLDSKFTNPPTWSVVLLYLYALIQVPWVQFADNELVETVMVSAALVLKCLLFLVVAWMLQSGVLFFYLDRLADLIANVESERDDYLRRLWGLSGSAPPPPRVGA